MLRIIALCFGCCLSLMAAAGGAPAPAAVDTGVGVEDNIPQLSTGATIVDCYDNAVARLEAICDDYRRIKAIQLSRQRDISFDEAYENISSVMPILKDINRQLLTKDIYNPDEIIPHKREVEFVESEVQIMVDLAAKLLEEIEKVQAEMQQQQQQEEQKVTLEEMVQREQFDPEQVKEMQKEQQKQETQEMKQLKELAKEEEKEKAKDLTEMMKKIMPLPDIKDLTKEEEKRAEKMKMDLMKSMTTKEGINKKMTVDQLNSILGRRVQSEDGEAVEWMFVDTWYTLGPFPNPSRINIHRKFPPETVVDLGAKYEGKGNTLIEWEFLQMGQPKCVPLHDEEYAIYYAYTEIWFDQPMDLWIAVGSDDKANVWINDMPVWISGDQLKGWRVDEGFRKVSFQPGVNRILYRVENGWKGTAFSLGLKVAP